MTRLAETDKRFRDKPRREDEDEVLAEAEAEIQRSLLTLEERTGKRVNHVRVDTRNFANCATEIFFVEQKT